MRKVAWVRLVAAVIVAPLSVFPALIAVGALPWKPDDILWAGTWKAVWELGLLIVLWTYIAMVIGLPIYVGFVRTLPRVSMWMAAVIGVITAFAAQVLLLGQQVSDLPFFLVLLALGSIVGAAFWLIARPDIYMSRTATSAS